MSQQPGFLPSIIETEMRSARPDFYLLTCYLFRLPRQALESACYILRLNRTETGENIFGGAVYRTSTLVGIVDKACQRLLFIVLILVTTITTSLSISELPAANPVCQRRLHPYSTHPHPHTCGRPHWLSCS